MSGWQTWAAAVLIGVLLAVVGVLVFQNREIREGNNTLLLEADRLKEEAVIQANRANKAVFEAEKFRKARNEAEVSMAEAMDQLHLERARADANAKRIARLPKPRDLHEANAQIVELHQQIEFQELALSAADKTIAEQKNALALDSQTIEALTEALYHRDRAAELYKGATGKEREHSKLLSKALRRERSKKAAVAIGYFIAGFGGGYVAGHFL